MKKRKFKDLCRYKFDNWMSRGTGAMLAGLALFVLVLTLIISLVIYLCGLGEGSVFYTFWDVLSTTINAWMPASGDGDAGYVALIAISALLGVLVTSVLIGIVSSAVEEKISSLRAGNSKVLEEGHMVVLGFKSGEYVLLEQLINSCEDKQISIVVAEEMERQEMEAAIRDNIDVPKNVQIICRNIDVTDPVALDCCSMETASLVIVNPVDDQRTVKALLAVAAVFKENDGQMPRVVGAVEQDQYIIPYHIRDEYGFSLLHTADILARIIAHSCTQPGLSGTFSEVFSFEGDEIYVEDMDVREGDQFRYILYTMENGVPLGIYRQGRTILNPSGHTALQDGDKVMVLEKSKGSFRVNEADYIDYDDDRIAAPLAASAKDEKVLIIGSNSKLGLIVNELPLQVKEVVLAGIRHQEEKAAMCKKIRGDIHYTLVNEDVMDFDVLAELVEDIDHAIVLSDYSYDEETSDIRNMMLIMNLRELRIRHDKTYSITSEMRCDDNRVLVTGSEPIDFIVSTNMSSMVLAQIALEPMLYDTFHELLSNEGSEFLLKEAGILENCVGVEKTVAELRRAAIHEDGILLGYITEEGGQEKTYINPELSKEVTLKAEDKLIVIMKD